MSGLIKTQVTKKTRKIYICDYCTNYFGREDLLHKHLEYCSKEKPVTTVMPEEGEFIEFKNLHHQSKVPFVLYVDFECFLKEINQKKGENTTLYQEHVPSGFGIYLKSFEEKVYPSKQISHYAKQNEEEDISLMLMEKLEEIMFELYHKFNFPKKIIFTDQDKKHHENTRTCYICQKELKENKKVKDHCHYTGKYSGAAHSTCNIQLKKPDFIPVFIHNSEGYDSHLFIKNLGVSEGVIKCIAKSEEKYMFYKRSCRGHVNF